MKQVATIALFCILGCLQTAFAQSFTMYKSVTIHVVNPDREGPVALDRGQVLNQWDKKIELGLGPLYRFSRLFGMLQNLTEGREISETSVEVPHVVVIARREDGGQVEMDLNLQSGIMALKGGSLKDGELYRELVRFVVEMAGEKLPSSERKQ